MKRRRKIQVLENMVLDILSRNQEKAFTVKEMEGRIKGRYIDQSFHWNNRTLQHVMLVMYRYGYIDRSRGSTGRYEYRWKD